MGEFRLAALLLAALVAFALVRSLAPENLLALILALLGLVCAAMTTVNLIQAWKANPRFLSGRALGWIQIGTGTALATVFRLLGQDPGSPAILVGLAYIGGGCLVVFTAALRAMLRRVK
ncbi:MAG: hypothetical protein JJU00_01880 [Opitutales bacterium]|nr:hypothetical protein [Opitutales bacterium]